MNTRWGIDLGGTKIEAVILDRNDPHTVICRKRIATEKERGYEHILGRIHHLLALVEKESGLQASSVGIGTPGTLDPGLGHMKNCNTTALNGRALKSDLESILKIPVELANDANCFALAEANMGIVQEVCPDAQVVFGVIMGTGVGGGVVIHGKVLNGKHGIGGEWGHIYLDDSGGECYCGKVGCVENVISGTALEAFYQEKKGHFLKLKEIVRLHKEGIDHVATETVERLLYFFGRGIAQVINVLDPDAIVLGGGVGNIDLLYEEGHSYIQPFIFNHSVETPLLKPKLGDSAGVFGAAFLV